MDRHQQRWPAASPDGLVLSGSGELLGLIEIKCPYATKDMTPLQAASGLPSFPCTVIDGRISLKRDHNYYYQVQGQLAITNASWCDYCVYTPRGLCTEQTLLPGSSPCKSLIHFFMIL